MLDKEVYNQLFKPSFSKRTQVTFWDGSVKEYGDSESEVIFKIIFNEKIPVKELINNASLALGEAYMEKKIEIEGDLQALIYDVYNQADGFFIIRILRNGCQRKSTQKSNPLMIFIVTMI